MDDFPVHGRGGQGVIAIQTTERNGDVVGATLVTPENEIMLITSGGTLVRTKVNEISVVGRNTQGVRLISLSKEETLSGIERIEDVQDDESESEEVESSETIAQASEAPEAPEVDAAPDSSDNDETTE